MPKTFCNDQLLQTGERISCCGQVSPGRIGPSGACTRSSLGLARGSWTAPTMSIHYHYMGTIVVGSRIELCRLHGRTVWAALCTQVAARHGSLSHAWHACLLTYYYMWGISHPCHPCHHISEHDDRVGTQFTPARSIRAAHVE